MSNITNISNYFNEDELFSSFLRERDYFYKNKLEIEQDHKVEIVDQTDENLLFTRSRDITVLEKNSSGQLLAKYCIEKRGKWFGYDKYDDFGRYIESAVI